MSYYNNMFGFSVPGAIRTGGLGMASSVIGALASPAGGLAPGLGEQFVVHDTPLDPAKAMITSAC